MGLDEDEIIGFADSAFDSLEDEKSGPGYHLCGIRWVFCEEGIKEGGKTYDEIPIRPDAFIFILKLEC